jgi:hypothetical protein
LRNLRKVEVWTSFLFFSLCLGSDFGSAYFCRIAEALGFKLVYKTWRNAFDIEGSWQKNENVDEFRCPLPPIINSFLQGLYLKSKLKASAIHQK